MVGSSSGDERPPALRCEEIPCFPCCSSSGPDFSLACLTFRLQWERAAVFPQEHAGSVTAITALSDFSTERSSSESYLVLTAGSDAKVHVWTWDVQSASQTTLTRLDSCSLHRFLSDQPQVRRSSSKLSRRRGGSFWPWPSPASLGLQVRRYLRLPFTRSR